MMTSYNLFQEKIKGKRREKGQLDIKTNLQTTE